MSILAPVHIFSGDQKELEEKNCFCLEPLLDGRAVVAHGTGNEHPSHEECLARWAKEKENNCPVCQGNIDTSRYQGTQKKIKGVIEDAWPFLATGGVGIQLVNTAFSSPYAHAASGLIGTYLMYQNMNQTEKSLAEKTVSCVLLAAGLGLAVYSGIGLYNSL